MRFMLVTESVGQHIISLTVHNQVKINYFISYCCHNKPEELLFTVFSSANLADRLWGSPILFSGYPRSFLGVKAARAWRCPLPFSAEIRNEWSCPSSYSYAFITYARATLPFNFIYLFFSAMPTISEGVIERADETCLFEFMVAYPFLKSAFFFVSVLEMNFFIYCYIVNVQLDVSHSN